MKKAIVLGLLVTLGAIPSLSKAFTVEEIQSVIKETVDTPSLTESTTAGVTASTTIASGTASSMGSTTITSSSTLSITSAKALIVVPEAKSNEVTLNIVKKTFRKILSFFSWK